MFSWRMVLACPARTATVTQAVVSRNMHDTMTEWRIGPLNSQCTPTVWWPTVLLHSSNVWMVCWQVVVCSKCVLNAAAWTRRPFSSLPRNKSVVNIPQQHSTTTCRIDINECKCNPNNINDNNNHNKSKWGPAFDPHPQPQNSLLKLSVCNQVLNEISYYGEPGRDKNCSRCNFQNIHSLTLRATTLQKCGSENFLRFSLPKVWWNLACNFGEIFHAMFSRVWVCEGKFHQNFTSKTVWKTENFTQISLCWGAALTYSKKPGFRSKDSLLPPRIRWKVANVGGGEVDLGSWAKASATTTALATATTMPRTAFVMLRGNDNTHIPGWQAQPLSQVSPLSKLNYALKFPESWAKSKPKQTMKLYQVTASPSFLLGAAKGPKLRKRYLPSFQATVQWCSHWHRRIANAITVH